MRGAELGALGDGRAIRGAAGAALGTDGAAVAALRPSVQGSGRLRANGAAASSVRGLLRRARSGRSKPGLTETGAGAANGTGFSLLGTAATSPSASRPSLRPESSKGRKLPSGRRALQSPRGSCGCAGQAAEVRAGDGAASQLSANSPPWLSFLRLGRGFSPSRSSRRSPSRSTSRPCAGRSANGPTARIKGLRGNATRRCR
mmetsp:Transcript_64145/g.139541  ORF Transcript_64145/g.139541 Transcript_64145/m.139541 type:complete len:202 (-) Transcript_64145:139-744(-)